MYLKLYTYFSITILGFWTNFCTYKISSAEYKKVLTLSFKISYLKFKGMKMKNRYYLTGLGTCKAN